MTAREVRKRTLRALEAGPCVFGFLQLVVGCTPEELQQTLTELAAEQLVILEGWRVQLREQT